MSQKLSHSFVAMMLKKYTPPGWRVLERDSGQGWRDPVDLGLGTIARTHFEEHIISIRPIMDAYHLFIFLHEVAHVKLHSKSLAIRATEEYQAERWAQTIFLKHNLAVTRQMRADARWRVRSHIDADEKDGITIHPKVRRWANYDAHKDKTEGK